MKTLLSFAAASLCIAAYASGPLMGWSSWNTYRVNINDSLICAQADALVDKGLRDAGYRQVNIDDGFFGYRDSAGTLVTHPQRFPRGLKAVADYIHSRGLKAGIYSDAGANTCGSLWDRDPNGVHVGLCGHEAQDADMYFNNLGFDFIKIDYCGAGQQLALDEEERYTEIINAIRSTAKKPVAINVCRWAYPGTWVSRLADSWRTTPDINPSWGSVKSIIAQNLYMAPYSSPGHYNDMDMLEIGRGLTPDEEITHFGIWCMMNSPLLIGCDLTSIPEASLNLLKNPELIAINQDPLGQQAEVAIASPDGTYVLARDLGAANGTERALALYNPTDTARTIAFDFADVLLGGKVSLRDAVNRCDAGAHEGRFSAVVPAHGTLIYRAKAESRIPRTRYEAEYAFLPRFDALGKRDRAVRLQPDSAASGRMIVANLGGSAANHAEWSDVACDEAGEYEITVRYKMPRLGREIADRRIEIMVNGNLSAIAGIDQTPGSDIRTASAIIRLEKGNNNIKIGSRHTWTPDIDCFEIRKI